MTVADSRGLMLLEDLANEDGEWRVWAIDRLDRADLRAVIQAALQQRSWKSRYGEFIGASLAVNDHWISLTEGLDDDENVSVEESRDRAELAARSGRRTLQRLAQFRPQLVTECLEGMRPDALRCACLEAAQEQEKLSGWAG